jgi:hypothetical protein
MLCCLMLCYVVLCCVVLRYVMWSWCNCSGTGVQDDTLMDTPIGLLTFVMRKEATTVMAAGASADIDVDAGAGAGATSSDNVDK